MRALAVTLWLAAAPVPPQTEVFYNARLALKDGDSAGALRLWLLRNSLRDRGQRATHDAPFRSVVWAALGNLGLCQDGFPKDETGLWPIALHNWMLQAAAKGEPPDSRNPFDAFEVGRQQRHISLHDVLSAPELRTVTFFRTDCLMPMLELRHWPGADYRDKLVLAPMLRELLLRALETVRRDHAISLAPIETRIFDLDLAIARLREQRARREGLNLKQRARRAGVSDVGAKEVEEQVRSSIDAAFLKKALTWEAHEWLMLSRERRLALYAQARPFAKPLDPLVMELIDALIEQRAGSEVEQWIGFLDASQRAALYRDERGVRLLELDSPTGFRERAVISLHRGVAYLETGALKEALRSFAFALSKSEESREGQQTLSLSRRWLAYVLSRYETNDDVVTTLKALVPKQEYNAVIEDLVWRAAFNADARSFERVVTSAARGGSFDQRAERLRPLSQGNAGAVVTQLREAMKNEPFLSLRFIRLLLERLELEEAHVRQANVPLMRALLELLEENTRSPIKSHARLSEELSARAQGILEGLRALDASLDAKARALAPGHQTFAGNIRLAPSDALPWPFPVPEVEAPSPFTPLVLHPVEWRDSKNELVFGWRLSE